MTNLDEDNPWPSVLDDDDKYFVKNDKDLIKSENDRSYKAKHQRNYRLRTDLFPMPFIGDIKKAEIYLLQANPGVSLAQATNEPATKKLQEFAHYRKSVQSCLRQDFSAQKFPFFFLDPELWWIQGSFWWRDTLSDLIQAVAREKWSFEAEDEFQEKINENDSREIYKLISRKICAVELHGYRSKNYRTPDKWFPSCEFQARIVEYALEEEKQLVLMRAKNDWNDLLREHEILEAGQELAENDRCMTLSNSRNVKISKNNLSSNQKDKTNSLQKLASYI